MSDEYVDQRCRDCGVEPGSLDSTGPCLNDQDTHDWVPYYEVKDIMEIGSGNGYPASALSNFAPHPFKFDGVECASMEGFLQALKFENQDVQVEVCKLVGLAAKRRGQSRNTTWQRSRTLWWRGVAYDRHGQPYQDLLDSAYRALFDQCPKFRKALLATQNATLKHSIGSTDSFHTVLTQREFCRRLTTLRELAKANKE